MFKTEFPAGELRHRLRCSPSDYEHPVLFDKTPTGALIEIPVTREEFDSVELGDAILFTLEHVGRPTSGA